MRGSRRRSAASSTAAYWPVRLIFRRTAARLGDDVEAGDPRGARVGAGQRGQDPHGRRLAGAVRPEQREHAAPVDLQVDAVEHGQLAVGLPQPGHLDRKVAGHVHSSRIAFCVFDTLFCV